MKLIHCLHKQSPKAFSDGGVVSTVLCDVLNMST